MGYLDYDNSGIGTGWIIVITILAMCVIAGISIGIYEYSRTEYEMPNGVVCKMEMTTGGGFGGATHEFRKCLDG